MTKGAVLGCIAALAVAVALLLREPIRSPWWTYADPDGAYVGSSLNILSGNHTDYLDHPGLPTQDALALGFGAEYLVEKATGRVDSREAFDDKQMLHLDRTRPLYRGWAILLYLGGVLAVYVLLSRLLGHWTWGLAGSLLFLSTPELLSIAFRLRPDTALSALCLVVAVVLTVAFERRSAARYLLAAALLGLAVSFKLPALGLTVPFAVAAVSRPPETGWARELVASARTGLRRHAYWLVPLITAWIAVCYVFNRERLPILTNVNQRHVLVYGITFLGGCAACSFVVEHFRMPGANRLFSYFNTLLLVALVAGFALPASLILDDGIQSVDAMWQSLTGGRVNENVDAFSAFSLRAFLHFPMRTAGIVFVLAIAGAILGARRRIWWPSLLALGSLVLATMAAARLSFPYYYGPAYAVAIPGALWALRRRGAAAPFLAWVVVLLILVPTIAHKPETSKGERVLNADAQQLADRLLKPGEVILAPFYFPIEDVRFDGLVDGFVDYAPAYPYRFLETGSARISERGLTPRYYIAPLRELESAAPEGGVFEISSRFGVGYRVRRVPIRWGPDGSFGVAEIVGK